MNDDQLLDRLRADLDSFVGTSGEAPTDLALAGPVPSRRPWVLVSAVAVTLAVLVSGLVLLARDDSARAPIATAGPVTVTAAVTTPPQPSEGMPVPPTPDGWQVVEWGDVRVSLPPDLAVGPGPECSSVAADGSQVVITCGDRTLTILSGTEGMMRLADNAVVRNGLTTELQPVPDLDGPTKLLLIGDTQSLVSFTGFADDEVAAIVETIGVSSLWRAVNERPPPVPAGWQTVQRDGFSFRVPADWPVSELTPPEPDPDVCGFAGVASGVMIGRGSLDASAVNCAAERILALPTDGVRVYPDDTGDGPRSLGNPYFSRIIDSVTPPQVILVGFGGDGTIGRTILGSVIEDAVDPAPGSTAPRAPATTTPTGDAGYETTGTVIDTVETGPMLCFSTLDSLPPQCGGGIPLAGWSWDLVDDEQETRGTVWSGSDELYIRGAYDPASRPAMAVLEVRPLTDADRERWSASTTHREHDLSVPCPEPDGGWPTTPADMSTWPGAAVEQLDGYAGSWIDASQRIYTVKIAGDVTAARAAISGLYDGAVCVVGAQLTMAQLTEIQGALMALSSVQVWSSGVVSDVSGEWVEATVVVPDPDLQDRLDAEYGDEVVRITSLLVPAA